MPNLHVNYWWGVVNFSITMPSMCPYNQSTPRPKYSLWIIRRRSSLLTFLSTLPFSHLRCSPLLISCLTIPYDYPWFWNANYTYKGTAMTKCLMKRFFVSSCSRDILWWYRSPGCGRKEFPISKRNKPDVKYETITKFI